MADINGDITASNRLIERILAAPGQSSSQRSRLWVSKSDITRYLRCPYSWWAFENGIEVKSPLALALIERGLRVHSTIDADSSPVEAQLTEAADGATARIDVPMLANPVLQIYGAPDGLVEADNELIAPVELKSHSRPRHSDDLELAFYSLLLSYRTDGRAAPTGYLVTVNLRGETETHTRSLTPRHFDKVRGLIQDVRTGRQNPPSDQYCGCETCHARIEDASTRERLERDELTMLWNLGSGKAEKLNRLGVHSSQELARWEPIDLHEKLRSSKSGISLKDVIGWQAHASSYRAGKPWIFNPIDPPSPPYFLLDTEYDTLDPSIPVFVVALGLVGDEATDAPSVWVALDEEQERQALIDLLSRLNEKPEWPIVTWNGVSADRSALRKAEERLGVEGLIERFDRTHVDAFLRVKNAVRFPTSNLSLKSVETFAGVSRTSGIDGGFGALALYHRLKDGSDSSKRNRSNIEKLRTYAEEDVIGLGEILNYLRVLEHTYAAGIRRH